MINVNKSKKSINVFFYFDREMGIKSTLHGRRFLSSRLVFQYDDEVLHPLKTKQHKPMDFWTATWFFDWLTSAGSISTPCCIWTGWIFIFHWRWASIGFLQEFCSQKWVAKFQGCYIHLFIGYIVAYIKKYVIFVYKYIGEEVVLTLAIPDSAISSQSNPDKMDCGRVLLKVDLPNRQ